MTTAMFVLSLIMFAFAALFCVAAWLIDDEDVGVVASLSGAAIAIALGVCAIVQFGMA